MNDSKMVCIIIVTIVVSCLMAFLVNEYSNYMVTKAFISAGYSQEVTPIHLKYIWIKKNTQNSSTPENIYGVKDTYFNIPF